MGDTHNSAPDVLLPGGEVHFGVHPSPRYGYATPRLMNLTAEGHGSFEAVSNSPQNFDEYPFSAFYQPTKTGGGDLRFDAERMVWYRFQLTE